MVRVWDLESGCLDSHPYPIVWSSVALGNVNSQCLHFLICKMEIIEFSSYDNLEHSLKEIALCFIYKRSLTKVWA